MSLLAVEDLEIRHGLLQAVQGVSLSIAQGEIVALVGANGAGKSTLLRTIAGAHKPYHGRVILDGHDVTAVSAHDRVKLGVALVPEGRRLFTAMTVEENLLLAGAVPRKGKWSLDEVLNAFPMLKARRRARCGHLSGGEQQATAIGRALMTNPRVLLLDEVSLGLSPLAVDQVYNSLAGLIASKTTIVLVEQDLKRAMTVASRVVCMLEGHIVLDAPAGDVTREQVTEAYFGLRRNHGVKHEGNS